MSLTTLVWPLFFAIVFGSVLGALVAVNITLTHIERRLKKIMPAEGFIRVDKIILTAKVSVDGHEAAVQPTISATYPEIESRIVEAWLDKRDLMMTPKGKEFAVRRAA